MKKNVLIMNCAIFSLVASQADKEKFTWKKNTQVTFKTYQEVRNQKELIRPSTAYPNGKSPRPPRKNSAS